MVRERIPARNASAYNDDEIGALKMQPEQAKFLLNFLLPQLKSEQTVTNKNPVRNPS